MAKVLIDNAIMSIKLYTSVLSVQEIDGNFTKFVDILETVEDAWKQVPLMIEIETFLRTVYTMLSRLSVKNGKFQELAQASEIGWWSRHLTLTALVRNYNTLINYFTDDLKSRNDRASKYCLKRPRNAQFRMALTAIMDILGELASMCKYFQRNILTSIEANQFVKAKICEIRSPYFGETVHCSDNFNDVIGYVMRDEDMKELSRMLDIYETFQASSADCEHGFSLMNSKKHGIITDKSFG
ncbi:hypothetical protein RF11_06936 [Thelohanellus kitauei]|uniref:Uncharacterized protein n=1 Tax=Thelohanellus kitauei TaxID=669202 RepID=A0A0C2JGU0_THEKT|nr:hypothetical protein RF11_06936 [Thelohanellus kitauei]